MLNTEYLTHKIQLILAVSFCIYNHIFFISSQFDLILKYRHCNSIEILCYYNVDYFASMYENLHSI